MKTRKRADGSVYVVKDRPKKQPVVGQADTADKSKPKEERLARMEGTTAFRNPKEGFGGMIDLTDQDVMAAVAASRRTIISSSGECIADPQDVGPECLETHFGSTQLHRRKLVRVYMATLKHDEPMLRVIARRLAATLAVQQLAGVKFMRSNWEEFAYLANTRRDVFEAYSHEALTWFLGEIEKSMPAFRRWLRQLREARATEEKKKWRGMASCEEREDRIRKKMGPDWQGPIRQAKVNAA